VADLARRADLDRHALHVLAGGDALRSCPAIAARRCGRRSARCRTRICCARPCRTRKRRAASAQRRRGHSRRLPLARPDAAPPSGRAAARTLLKHRFMPAECSTPTPTTWWRAPAAWSRCASGRAPPRA
jgi:hypothetical protein